VFKVKTQFLTIPGGGGRREARDALLYTKRKAVLREEVSVVLSSRWDLSCSGN
jgi:hypothetical protein